MGGTESYKREVTDLVKAGWRVEEETPDRVTLVNRTVGSARMHLIIAVFTIWWLMGIPNVLYAAYKYFADTERTIVWKESTNMDDSSEAMTETG